MEGGLIKFLTRGATAKIVEDPREKAELLVDTFHNNLHNRYNLYALSFFLCEQINALVLLLAWLATDGFLKGQFALYGPSVFAYYNLIPTEERERFSANPMCEVFPRIGGQDWSSEMAWPVLTECYFQHPATTGGGGGEATRS